MRNDRIAVIAPIFFGYEKAICLEFRRRGFEVHFFPDRPFRSAAGKAVVRFARRLAIPSLRRFTRRIHEQLTEIQPDVVLVINGEGLIPSLFARAKAELPQARFIFYAWDSIRLKPGILRLITVFDKAFSYDDEDCRQTDSLHHLPLFLIDEYLHFAERTAAPELEIDLLFLGTVHGDRAKILHGLKRSLPSGVKFEFVLFSQSRWVYFIRRLLDSSMRALPEQQFRTSPLSAKSVARLVSKSRAVLDIHHPKQSGLTMRTFETLGMGRKLVTTNETIKRYPFYCEQNVLVLDRSAPRVPPGFLDEPFKPIDGLLMREFGLRPWVGRLLRC